MQLVGLYLKSKMPKLIKQTTGYLSRIIKGDKKYAIHLNVPGVILIGESEKKYPGKQFIYIFSDRAFTISYFHTSCGTITQIENKLIFKSDDSSYEFTVDEHCLDEITKAEILLNIGEIF